MIETILIFMEIIDICTRYLALCFGIFIVPYAIYNFMLTLFNKIRSCFK